jgi:hypothetical protein
VTLHNMMEAALHSSAECDKKTSLRLDAKV